MIRYKVVSRYSYSIIVSDICSYHTKYSKNKVLVDTKGMGFFCFKTREDAERFNDNFLGRVIKVKTLSRGYVPKIIACSFINVNLNDFYKSKKVTHNAHATSNIPKGTICYKKIKVLE